MTAIPNSKSWMNYPQLVPNFWDDFRFEFDTEELLPMRHGDSAAVIMGGDAWSSGGHFDKEHSGFVRMEGDFPMELLVPSKGYFEFIEPVYVEVRLRNLLECIVDKLINND